MDPINPTINVVGTINRSNGIGFAQAAQAMVDRAVEYKAILNSSILGVDI